MADECKDKDDLKESLGQHVRVSSWLCTKVGPGRERRLCAGLTFHLPRALSFTLSTSDTWTLCVQVYKPLNSRYQG